MENQELKTRTMKSEPYYYGAFLNMARLNIFNISNHLSNKLNILPTLSSEEHIANAFFTDKNTKIKWEHTYDILRRFIPIVKVFDTESLPKGEVGNNTGKDFSKMSDTLKIIFKELNEFRNDYSHYYSTEKEDKRKITISDELANFLNENFKRAIAYTKKRFKGVFTEKDFELANNIQLFNKDKEITEKGLAFLTSIFLEREYAFQFISKIEGLKGTQKSEYRATREVFMAYCVNLPHDKFISEDAKQSFSLDIISELNRCPQTLFNVITEKEQEKFRPTINQQEKNNIINNSVPYDIEDYEEYVNSITKKIRYDNRFPFFALKFIDETQVFEKIRFQIDLGEILLDEYTKQLANNEEKRQVVQNAKAFGRLNDFIDENNVLENINKQNGSASFIQYAPNYNFDNNKIGIDTTGKRIMPILTKQTDNNKKVKNKLKQPLPKAFLSIHELPKIILLEYLEKGKAEKLINDFLLINESQLLNYKYIEEIKNKLNNFDVFQKRSQRKKLQTAYNKTNIEELQSRKEELNKILKEYKLNDKQIPTRILEYWLNIEDVTPNEAISDRIKLMKRDCVDRLRDIKKGKAPKIGEMATFIAKDIVDMIISKDIKQKISSFYYDKIQECLALYNVSEKRDLFLTICNELRLLDADKGHPFLKNINLNRINYTSDFYVKYLQEKGHKLIKETNYRTGKLVEKDKSWMFLNFYYLKKNETLNKMMTIVQLPDDKSKLPFTIAQLDKPKNTFEEWINNITKGKTKTDKEKPIDLPTNIFDKEIEEILKNKLSEEKIAFTENANYNQLFKLWWTDCRKDNVQKFYDAEREYVIYDEHVKFIPNTKPKFENYYNESFPIVLTRLKRDREEARKLNRKLPPIEKSQVEKVFKQAIGSTEKEIRLLQEEDRIMLLMFEQLLETDNNLNLKLNNAESLLNEQITIKEKISLKLSFNEQEDKKEIIKTIIDKRKRKDFSILRKFKYDKRLPELCEYFETDDISHSDLKKELDEYNKAKEQILANAFMLEKTIIEKDKDGIKALFLNDNGEKKYGNVQHKPYLTWLKNKGLINDNEYLFINMVRNTFSHNQFPQKRTIQIFIDKNRGNPITFAETIKNAYNKKIEEIIVKIK
ncbi:MAG: hypothetical protein A2X12_08015 [Bacteroidetes bacterium GWE2_29_8]|nr:MAG: hypothetical protein A2X12_08015 [Bacteroidetes bacterium GWE2_29_8]OFY18498.1 MAG: hypothetical protein A2X02_07740 [Bacteroidetes bacterium GWF2_29_10]